MPRAEFLLRRGAPIVEQAVGTLMRQGGVDEAEARRLLAAFGLRVGRSAEELARLLLKQAISYANVTGSPGPEP